MFLFPVCPEDIYANIVGESMHDVPLIFEFYLLCILQNALAVYLLLLWIKSFVLWSCTWGTSYSGKNNWVPREMKCWFNSRGGQKEGENAVHWREWAASWLWRDCSGEGLRLNSLDRYLCSVRADRALASSQNHLSSSRPASSPDPATQSGYCTIPFPSISVWEILISETIVPIQIQIMFCKGWKTEARGWIVAT